MQDEILDRLAVMRGLWPDLLRLRGVLSAKAFAGPGPAFRHRGVEVQPPHLQWVTTDGMRHMVQHPFDPQHPLRTAEPPESGGGLGVRFQPIAFDPHIRNEIGIVGMQHRAVGNRQAQVHRPATAAKLQEIDDADPTLVVMANGVLDLEIVALAGNDEIVVPVIAHGTGPTGLSGGNGAGDCERIALAFLAAEPASHAAHFAAYGIHRNAESVSNLVLDLRRMLGGRVNNHVVPLLRKGECCLPLQIEMLLPADLDLALQDMFRLIERSRRIATVIGTRAIFEPTAGVQSLANRQDRGQFFILDQSKPCSSTRGQMGVRDHQKDRLADEMHRSLCKQRLGRRGR